MVGLEHDRDTEGHDGSETDPPREFHRRQPIGFDVGNLAKDSRDRVREIAENRDHDKAGNHGNEIAAIVPARFRQHAREKNSENGAVSVTINPEHNRNDAHIRPDDDKIRCGRGNDDHQNRKPDRSPTDRAQTIYTVSAWANVGDVPIAGKTSSQRVERSAKRTHGGCENPGEQQSAQAHRHFIKDVVTKNFVRRFRYYMVLVGLIKNPEQDADAEKGECDRNIGQPRHDERTPAPAHIGRGQHPLHHVLIRAVR